MAVRNSDGTVTIRTTGKLFRDSSGSLPQTRGFNARNIPNGGGVVYAGATGRVGRPGWRIVSKTER